MRVKPRQPSKKHSRARARARPAAGTTKAVLRESHVREIMRVMAAGGWRTGLSHAQFAASWRASEDTVRRVAGEASRRLRALAGEHDDEIRGRLLAEVERIGELAIDPGQERPDYRAALVAIELRAKLLGTLTHNVKIEGFGQLSDEELRRQHAEMLARHRAKK